MLATENPRRRLIGHFIIDMIDEVAMAKMQLANAERALGLAQATLARTTAAPPSPR